MPTPARNTAGAATAAGPAGSAQATLPFGLGRRRQGMGAQGIRDLQADERLDRLRTPAVRRGVPTVLDRIERAKDLLRYANLTVTEVCLLVGFTSLGSFSSRFTDLVGVSPTAYRRMQHEHDGQSPVPGCFLFTWIRPAPLGPERPHR